MHGVLIYTMFIIEEFQSESQTMDAKSQFMLIPDFSLKQQRVSVLFPPIFLTKDSIRHTHKTTTVTFQGVPGLTTQATQLHSVT